MADPDYNLTVYTEVTLGNTEETAPGIEVT